MKVIARSKYCSSDKQYDHTAVKAAKLLGANIQLWAWTTKEWYCIENPNWDSYTKFRAIIWEPEDRV